MAMKLPNVPRPCSNCPFRKDTLKGWLGSERATEICESESFTCHKTSKPRLQCAGHMLLMKDNNAFFALAKALKIDLKLTGGELVFDSTQDFIKHHTHHDRT